MVFDILNADLGFLFCRPKRNVNLSKADMKSNPAVFNFRSDERAERRKEASKQCWSFELNLAFILRYLI